MNVDSTSGKESKANRTETPARQNPLELNKKALQQDGLRQAATFYQQSVTVDVKASGASIGMTVMSRAFESALVINGQHPKADKLQREEEQESPAFDFEKIAANVMKFVGGVIRGAAINGADNQKLTGLFEQAREGVQKGFAMARKELEGFMTDELEEGIKNSETLIEEKMSQLEDEMFGRSERISATAVSYSATRSSELEIRTKEGDRVSISFGSRQNLNYVQGQQQSFGNGDDNSGTTSWQSLNIESTRGLQISVQGELSKDELEGIAELVEKTDDLASTFFSDDIDKAFEQASALGFDESTLAGFSLNLQKRETLGMASAYSDIKAMESNQPVLSPTQKAISEYLSKMLKTLELADKKLEGEADYQALVQSVINQMEDVQVPDLVSAINRFNGFNQQARQVLS
ncbi:DUF5610 domain-containing protein [Salinimonas lutimaris]|uniref:DUF5610 domain-containing protein n=1 Tax=Salinimonas lutimaris TaxID=914153 RepID=UPI0010C0FA6B|nr:DUF5610 domain-containing protein [Salinimonas lutimaris]